MTFLPLSISGPRDSAGRSPDLPQFRDLVGVEPWDRRPTTTVPMAELARSSDPVVTFSSLADKLAGLGYTCVVEILQDRRMPQRINRPAPASEASEASLWTELTLLLESEPMLVCDGSLVGVSFCDEALGDEASVDGRRDDVAAEDVEARPGEPSSADPDAGEPATQEVSGAFVGGLVVRRREDVPVTAADAETVRALVEHAVGVVAAERLHLHITAEQTRVAQLERALADNRDIGVAIGIVMARRRCDADAALDLLHAACRGGRSIPEVAAHVLATRELPPPLARPHR